MHRDTARQACRARLELNRWWLPHMRTIQACKGLTRIAKFQTQQNCWSAPLKQTPGDQLPGQSTIPGMM